MSGEPKTGHADKLASMVARDIEADIVRRGWAVGESLGSELALQQRFGVSRSVLREAVRLVEHHQVARMRRGPNGGLYICEPDAGPATRAVVIYLEYLGTTLGDLLNARLVLEPLAASLAAERIDEAGIARLGAVLDAEEQWKPGLPAPRDEFHIALAEQSKNPVLQLFINVLMRLTTRYALASRTDSATEAIEAVDHLHAHHSKIVAAVTAGDSARAKTLSERHVEAVTAWLQQHHPGDKSRRRKRRRRLDVEAPRGKLAELLAVTIGDDIAASGWHVGSVFGTETALLERYRVSRAVLREAVRLPEYHSIAQMRRGPGGGLVIAEPAAQASIDTIALYPQYRAPAVKTYGASATPSRSTTSPRSSSGSASPRWRRYLPRIGPSCRKTHNTRPTKCGRPSRRSSTSTPGWRNSPATRCWICSFESSSSCSPALV